MTAARQAALYYARRRRLNNAGETRLFRTHDLAPGFDAADIFRNSSFSQPVVFRFRVDLSISDASPLFAIGTDIALSRINTGELVFLVRGVRTVAIATPDAGNLTLVVAIVPGAEIVRAWDSSGPLPTTSTGTLPGGTWGRAGAQTIVNALMRDRVSIFINQRERRFDVGAGSQAAEGLFALVVVPGIGLDEETLYALGVGGG